MQHALFHLYSKNRLELELSAFAPRLSLRINLGIDVDRTLLREALEVQAVFLESDLSRVVAYSQARRRRKFREVLALGFVTLFLYTVFAASPGFQPDGHESRFGGACKVYLPDCLATSSGSFGNLGKAGM
jgi:hypothetical protein